MNVLVVSTDAKLEVTAPFWAAAKNVFEYRHKVVIGELGLLEFVNSESFSQFDRVVIDGNLRRIVKKVGYGFLKRVPNLIVFDHDMLQNEVSDSELYGKYISILRDINNIRVVVSGKDLCDKFVLNGIDAGYLPKAYDSGVISNLGGQRDVKAAFVGRTKNKAYRKRKEFLAQLDKEFSIPVLRASPGEAYNKLLNRISIFVSVDIGYGEYMIKNFEAMAAGCVLMAFRQSNTENSALGFKDMENIVLYSSIEEFSERFRYLQENPDIALEIAVAGEHLARSRHAWSHRAKEFYKHIEPEIKPATNISWRDRLKLLSVRH